VRSAQLAIFSGPLGGRFGRMPDTKGSMNPLLQLLRGPCNGPGPGLVGEGRTKGPDVIYWFWAVLCGRRHL